jgi:hypothetical protein
MVGARGFDPQEAPGPPTILCTPDSNLVGARGFDPQEAPGPPTILCTPDCNNGRGERIRTSDPLHPMQMRYQAALRPDDSY